MTADQYEEEQQQDASGRVVAGAMALALMLVMACAGCDVLGPTQIAACAEACGGRPQRVTANECICQPPREQKP